MNQLPKWVLANPFPAIHDFESLTVLEQTARLYGAMAALIKEYNIFSETMTKQLATFSENEKEAREDFQHDMMKVVRQLMCGGSASGTPSVRATSIDLAAANWTGSGNLYSQVVQIDGVTENSQVNLAPSVEQMADFYDEDVTFVVENDGGVVTVYVIGQMPQKDYEIQASVVEVYK